jgi:hypothetical protein
MLRPEFQDWYPSLEAGRWYPASELTTFVVDHLRHGSPQWRSEGRIPSNQHFVFRGDAAIHPHLRNTTRTDWPQRSLEERGASARPDP